MIKLNEQKTCLNKDHCNYQYFLFLYKVILHVYLCVEISTKYSKSFKSHIFPKMYIHIAVCFENYYENSQYAGLWKYCVVNKILRCPSKKKDYTLRCLEDICSVSSISRRHELHREDTDKCSLLQK